MGKKTLDRPSMATQCSLNKKMVFCPSFLFSFGSADYCYCRDSILVHNGFAHSMSWVILPIEK